MITRRAKQTAIAIIVTVLLLQACVSCTVAKNKQTRTTVTDSLSKTTIRDSIIYHHREAEQGRDASQYERVTTITPTVIRDSNVIRVYPTTVIRETGERVIEYRRDSGDSLMVVRLQAKVDSLSKVEKVAVKVKETKWPWWVWVGGSIGLLLVGVWLYRKKPV